jgi:lysophospholipase L1-like esterase
MMVGDSNTHFLPCAYPLVLQARYDPKRVHVFDEGIFGSAAFGWIRDGSMAPRLQADQPTAVVLALGTNDLGLHRLPGLVIKDVARLYEEVERFTLADGRHPKAYVATVPPVYVSPIPSNMNANVVQALEARISLLNSLIRVRFHADRVVDFDSWMPAQWTAGIMFAPVDGIHLGCDAHKTRADILQAML